MGILEVLLLNFHSHSLLLCLRFLRRVVYCAILDPCFDSLVRTVPKFSQKVLRDPVFILEVGHLVKALVSPIKVLVQLEQLKLRHAREHVIAGPFVV